MSCDICNASVKLLICGAQSTTILSAFHPAIHTFTAIHPATVQRLYHSGTRKDGGSHLIWAYKKDELSPFSTAFRKEPRNFYFRNWRLGCDWSRSRRFEFPWGRVLPLAWQDPQVPLSPPWVLLKSLLLSRSISSFPSYAFLDLRIDLSQSLYWSVKQYKNKMTMILEKKRKIMEFHLILWFLP